MKNNRVISYLIVTVALGIGIILCARTTQPSFDQSLPVCSKLPTKLSPYRSFTIYHCQNEECLKSFSSENLTSLTVCPKCGGKLDTVSLAEHRLLPKDTTILHRSYRDEVGHIFNVAVVIGGHERRSIHKPQVCIVGQGNTINKQELIKVPLDHKKNLDVMLLDVNRDNLYFAYWFTDGKRETARHLTRLFDTAWDGVVHNQRRRWAYISISVNNTSMNTLPELKTFIRRLYPEINKFYLPKDDNDSD